MHIKVKARAGAKKEMVERADDDTFHISVKEKAERNQANRRILRIVSRELSVPEGDIQIVAGHHSPNKILFIRNI